MSARVVLVTGAARYLGGVFAEMIAGASGVERVIGVDALAPERDVPGMEFHRVDIRSPHIGALLAEHEVDTVVHMGVLATSGGTPGRAVMKEINVIGSMQLLASCQKAPGVKRLVVKSTAGVYGASPRDPAMFTEDASAKVLPRSGWAKDSVEVEGYVRAFARRRPDVDVSVLRFANFIGPGVRTVFTEYFDLSVIPVPLGFDPRLQFIHTLDGMEALRLATLGGVAGTFNIAGPGVVTLLQAAAICGKPVVPVPAPLLRTAVRRTSALRRLDLPEDYVAHLRYGRVQDTRGMGETLGLVPSFSTRQAIEDFATSRAGSRLIKVGV